MKFTVGYELTKAPVTYCRECNFKKYPKDTRMLRIGKSEKDRIYGAVSDNPHWLCEEHALDFLYECKKLRDEITGDAYSEE
jgi:hypothetical protein